MKQLYVMGTRGYFCQGYLSKEVNGVANQYFKKCAWALYDILVVWREHQVQVTG